MPAFKEMASDFLAQDRFAVVGVSRGSGQTANMIYKFMKKKGYQVFPINPHTDTVEGDACYPSVKEVPGQLDGVVIVARPDVAAQVMQDCVERGIPRVWMHENPFAGAAASSVSDEAATLGKANGITVIAGGCPMMFLEFGHKCMRWLLGAMGRLPQAG